MTTYRLMDGTSGRPGNGPATVTAYSGNMIMGINFNVTTSAIWFQGYWWWVPGDGDTGAQKFALWSEGLNRATSNLDYSVVPGSVVTSGTLTAGAWNYVPLPAPLELTISASYCAATGWVAVNGFPQTLDQFGTGDPYAAGITNGPLTAYSDYTGTMVPPWGGNPGQSVFTTAGSDPSLTLPGGENEAANFWIDVQVSDTAPGDRMSYRLFPNVPDPPQMAIDNALNFTLGTEFSLSQACTVGKVWFFSPPGVTQLPTDCGFFKVSDQSTVQRTTSPSWSGAAGSRWIYCDYSSAGLTLPAGDYKVAVLNSADTPAAWSSNTQYFWDDGSGFAISGWKGAPSGITDGPLSAPPAATASDGQQGTYNVGTAWTYPATVTGVLDENFWVDVEVTLGAAPAAATFVYSMRMMP